MSDFLAYLRLEGEQCLRKAFAERSPINRRAWLDLARGWYTRAGRAVLTAKGPSWIARAKARKAKAARPARRVSIREDSYRGKDGFTVTRSEGKGHWPSRIFTEDRAKASALKRVLKAREDASDATSDILLDRVPLAVVIAAAEAPGDYRKNVARALDKAGATK